MSIAKEEAMSNIIEKKETAFGDVTVERFVPGKPHEGKVLAAVQAHSDDIPFFCAGTVAKLIEEGYTGYLIQTTNDEKCGPTSSIGETVLSNERDVEGLAEVLGLRKVFNLGYRNHRMDEASPLELRARMIFLFRALKVDTVFTFNPWGHGEENPDHYVTAQAVEAARWMAGMGKDYPEQIAAGIKPHGVRELYYWVARPGQPYNRVVDISAHIEKKVASAVVCRTQGPGPSGSRLKARLAKQGLRLPALGDDDEAADREYIRLFGLKGYRKLGQEYGLEYAEQFYYVPSGGDFIGSMDRADIEDYIAKHAVPIE
jgi:LmbE family N-acetylglucosaminyl deacetylase